MKQLERMSPDSGDNQGDRWSVCHQLSLRPEKRGYIRTLEICINVFDGLWNGFVFIITRKKQ